jgi:putative acetyltransferase
MIIRAEREKDYSDVRHVNEMAFGRRQEADLVEALRRSARPYISLVAALEGEIAGHIFFSPVSIHSDESVFEAVGLAPVAVLPEHQNGGVGSALIREGLEECRRAGRHIVVVLGHPKYYPRFGFHPAGRMGLACEYDVPGEHFMVAELSEGALAGRRGLVIYHPAFAGV